MLLSWKAVQTRPSNCLTRITTRDKVNEVDMTRECDRWTDREGRTMIWREIEIVSIARWKSRTAILFWFRTWSKTIEIWSEQFSMNWPGLGYNYNIVLYILNWTVEYHIFILFKLRTDWKLLWPTVSLSWVPWAVSVAVAATNRLISTNKQTTVFLALL